MLASAAMSSFNIREATRADTVTILGFIHELAEYEKLSHEVVATPEILERTLFGPNERKVAEVLIGEVLDDGQQPRAVGFALFFHSFSTFLGLPGIYLEDLYVQPEYRGRGYGEAILRRLAKMTVERGCGRLEWAVLDWNDPAIGFYRKLGAESMDEWTVFRLSGKTLRAVAR
jgi:GNAT superfamily N-acetyltransferase